MLCWPTTQHTARNAQHLGMGGTATACFLWGFINITYDDMQLSGRPLSRQAASRQILHVCLPAQPGNLSSSFLMQRNHTSFLKINLACAVPAAGTG